jgi:NADH-quinone oxidoreductase subunit L
MNELFAVKYSFLIPLLPLFGAAISGFFGAKILRQKSHWPIWLGVGLSAIISLSLLCNMISMWRGGEEHLWAVKDWYTWIEAGSFKATAGFFFDPLTAVMLSVVTGIGFLITVFSAGYMKGEAGYFRFFAYLGLFIFAMTCLVMGNNFVMLYLGWEGVGLCSYLLIGYYYEKPSAVEAAKKAFLVNRIGDFGFGLGIMLIWKAFGSVSYFGDGAGTAGVFQMAAAPTHGQAEAMKYIPFLLMLGAFGKSAQFPLYVWLPDAMEGPTPVSALIHAATMVTAGVYMIARCSALFVTNDLAMITIACVGAFTALLAATIALRQFDLKKVFAYSTISQLGYMFAGVGVLAPVAGVFHLVTHAFFKALLFLSSGVVMHAMAGELDMRKMSGLKRVLPLTNILMLIGCLALSAFPLFSGFFSKDDIVTAVMQRSPILGVSLLVTALMTAYYTFRLYFRVFQGPLVVPAAPAADHSHDHGDDHGHDQAHGAAGHDDHGGHGDHAHNHEPMIMMLPLILLAIGAIFAGYINWPTHSLGNFLEQSPSIAAIHAVVPITETHEPPITLLMIISAGITILGIFIAYVLHLKNRPLADRLAESLAPITNILDHKFWVDEIYQRWIVESLRGLGTFCYEFIDQLVVDGLVALTGLVPQIGGFVMKLATQRGYLQGYAAVMLLGIAAILLFIFV